MTVLHDDEHKWKEMGKKGGELNKRRILFIYKSYDGMEQKE